MNRPHLQEIEPPDAERGLPVEGDLHVVLLDSSVEHAASMVENLQAAGMMATAFQTKQSFLQFLETRRINVAIIAIESKSWWRDELRLFCNSIRYVEENLDIICILRWPPTNPLDRLYGDALRVSVMHEW